jgi:VanZ family protein
VSSARHFSIRAACAWLLFALWAIGITILSSMPGERFGPSPFFEADKVVHMGLFALGGAALTGALRLVARTGVMKTAFLALGVMALVGMADEIHQLWTPGRSGGDLGDWTADVIGAALGIACVSLLYGRRTSKSPLPAPGADRAT